ncbi:MAG TPA: hypothetical protein VKV21_09035 [Solirubrobacteraceae bacterium]|nr:hypothetical protein [Solirubrobacteraceae bacterium]
MWHGVRGRALAGLAVLAGLAGFAPGASASVTAGMSVTSSTPVTAGSTGTLGLDLRFNPSAGDAPDHVTLNLPPGVLANASIDNGQCLKTTTIASACQIGSGTVTASALGTPIPTPVNFYLVPPPAAGDLAGLEVTTQQGDQVGTTNAIVIRPSGDPNGVGVTLDLTLPNSLYGVPVAVTDINSSFSGVRFPATCPSTPANVTMSVDSYNVSTPTTASTPLPVTGCGALPYNPQYSLSAVKDAHDKAIAITTTITQSAAESPNGTVSLTFPRASMAGALTGLTNLCSSVSSGTCKPVGSVTAASPDYPTPLTGKAYLTGTLHGLSLTIVFPAPFPLTLVGAVDLTTNTTTFSGLPDIPLTNLTVALNGGSAGLFDTSCGTPTNVSTSKLTDQNGDKTASPAAHFTIQGCGSSGSGSGSGSSSGSSGAPRVSSTHVGGLAKGRPSLRFTVHAARRTRLSRVTVELPRGLAFRSHLVHRVRRIRGGLRIRGARLRSERIVRGHLVLTFRRPVRSVTVILTSRGLRESAALRREARRRRLKRLRLTVLVRTSGGRSRAIHVTLRHFGL